MWRESPWNDVSSSNTRSRHRQAFLVLPDLWSLPARARGGGSNVVLVPDTIPADGSVDVTRALAGFIASVADGSTIRFPAGGAIGSRKRCSSRIATGSSSMGTAPLFATTPGGEGGGTPGGEGGGTPGGTGSGTTGGGIRGGRHHQPLPPEVRRWQPDHGQQPEHHRRQPETRRLLQGVQLSARDLAGRREGRGGDRVHHHERLRRQRVHRERGAGAHQLAV